VLGIEVLRDSQHFLNSVLLNIKDIESGFLFPNERLTEIIFIQEFLFLPVLLLLILLILALFFFLSLLLRLVPWVFICGDFRGFSNEADLGLVS